MNIWEIKLLCLSTLHQAPSRAWKHSSKSFANIQTPLSFTIVILLHRAVFPHFNFIYVVKMKESLLEKPQCITVGFTARKLKLYGVICSLGTFLIFDPYIIITSLHKIYDISLLPWMFYLPQHPKVSDCYCLKQALLISKGWMLMWYLHSVGKKTSSHTNIGKCGGFP